VRQINDHVRAAIKRRAIVPVAEQPEDPTDSPEAASAPEPAEAPQPRLFERRGRRFVLFPEAFGAGNANARAELVGHLRRFLTALEAPRG